MKPGDLVLPTSFDQMLFNDNLPNHGLADYHSEDVYRWLRRSGLGLVIEVRKNPHYQDINYVKVLVHQRMGWTLDKNLSKVFKDI